MTLRYFVVDARGQLCKASNTDVRRLWTGKLRADALGCPNGNELRVVSVVCDADLLPKRVYLLRLPLESGQFTLVSRLTLRAFARPDCVTTRELVHHHTEGWPPDFFRQLAVALDVPLKRLGVPFGIGGPLMIAAAKRVSPREAARYLQ